MKIKPTAERTRVYAPDGRIIEEADSASYYFTQVRLGGPYLYLGAREEAAAPESGERAGASASSRPAPAAEVDDGADDGTFASPVRWHEFVRTAGDEVLLITGAGPAPDSDPHAVSRPAGLVVGALGAATGLVALATIPWSPVLAVFVAVVILCGTLLGFIDKPPVNYVLAAVLAAMVLVVLPLALLFPH